MSQKCTGLKRWRQDCGSSAPCRGKFCMYSNTCRWPAVMESGYTWGMDAYLSAFGRSYICFKT